MKTKSPPSEFYSQIKQDTMVFSNIMFIFEKIEEDHHLEDVTSTLKRVIEKELSFASQELSKLKQTYSDLDVHSQLIQNTLIFKENFKLILNSLSSLIS